jgi:diguanylate cyclase (GGDEF)-like protein/PAS domain S-box-containing protein/putative nucleotidyltransferase with HDIG domain
MVDNAGNASKNTSIANELSKTTEILESISDGFFALDRDWCFTYVNTQAGSNLGFKPEELIGQNIWKKFPQFMGIEIELKFRKAIAEGQPQEAVVQGPITDRWHNVRVYPFIEGISVYWQDITEYKKIERMLTRERDRARQLFEEAAVMFLVLNVKGVVTQINAKASKILGYKPDEIVGKNWVENFLPQRIRNKFKADFDKLRVGTLKLAAYLEHPVLTKRGEERLIGWHNSFIKDESGKIIGILSSGEDITERKLADETIKSLSEKMSQLSTTDELTKLYNRRHFYQVLGIEIDRARRYKRPLSLAILDIDRFKEINDNFGHTIGDSVLKSLARILTSSLRRIDTPFRYGGDEFAVILPETDYNKAKNVLERVRLKWLHMPKTEQVLENPIGFSAGIAEFPKNAETQDNLVFLADAALYSSKKTGGNRSTLVFEMGEIPSEVLVNSSPDQIYELAAMVDAREVYGYGHSMRVASIAETIGKNLGISSDELNDLHAAALLHDIGKIGISEAILNKSDQLTASEWAILKKHSMDGAKIISQIRNISNLAPLILHHHECYDGTGYPDGLKGPEIPLCSRIIGVADAYDTMVTPRIYGNIRSRDEALIELERCSGTQFDPEIIEVVLTTDLSQA